MNLTIRNMVSALALFMLMPLTATAQVDITEKPEYESLEDMITYAKTLERRPYRNGATGPYAFDCSGFTQFCFKKLGITLARTSAQQGEQGKKIRRTRYLKPGDLVCFNGSKIGKDIGHVGIVVETDGKQFKFIHASSSVGITISNSETKYYDDRYICGRRITRDKTIRRAIKKYSTGLTAADYEEEKQEALARKERANKRQQKNEQTDAKKEQAQKQQNNNPAPNNTVKPAKNDAAKADTTHVTPMPADTTTKADTTKSEPSGTNVVKTLIGPYHTVVKGDTLYNIAKRAGCTVQQLQEWNHLDGNSLGIGQVIRIKAE
ncbi:MAG: NlpC/P60 family protein [Paludibacteraceae bacterium]|nr:NlpC/P60 family protein [Paludibacteraceae bacterium]